MLTTMDHVLFAVLVAFFPIWGVTYGYRRLHRADTAEVPRVRLSIYRWALTIQWSLAILTLLLWISRRRPLAELGLAPRPTWGLLGVLVGFLIVAFLLRRQRVAARRDPETLELVRERLHHLERMMPHTRDELRWFIALAITAGVCEELLYRGYVIWYLAHGIGLIQAAGLAAVIFGVGHAYQGPRGMLITGFAGLFLGAVYLLTGSLFASMLLHATMDFHTGQLAFAAFSREGARQDTMLEEVATDEGMPEPPPRPGLRTPSTPAAGSSEP